MRVVLVFAIIFLAECQSANILGLFSHPGKSHHILGEVLFKALVKKGHNVTMASPFPLKKPLQNYTDIDIFETRDDMNERHKNNLFQKLVESSIWNFYGVSLAKDMILRQAELLFHNEQLKSVIETQQFDLIISDLFYNEVNLVYGHILNCPVIYVASAGSSSLTNHIMGNPHPYSYVPNKISSFTSNMNIFQRLQNTLLHFITELLLVYQMPLEQQNIVDRYIADVPKIAELLPNVAMILCNSHYSFESVRPNVPNMVYVGGFHIEKSHELPADIKQFIDDAKYGVILFSLGLNMKSSYLGSDKIKGILNAFSKLKMKVLWKFEDDQLEVPDNVLIRTWFPQNDILAHPNVKLFITHGGLLSTIESVYHGVPMIGIPMFADQHSNVPNSVELGYALQILNKDISENSMYEAITEITTNLKYAKAAKFRSNLLKNQPIDPMENAIFWIEHVIEHKGAEHLKNGSIKFAWYQNMLLDVLALLLAAFVLMYYCLRMIFFNKCNKKKTTNEKNKMKKN